MASAKSREDEAYQQGVHDGQNADFMDQITNSMTKGFSLDPRLNEIYQSGYQYGVSHRPAPDNSRHQEEPTFVPEQNVVDSSPEGSSGTEIIVKIVVAGLIFFAILWFVFAVAVPLLMIDIAAIALIASLTRKHLSKWLLPLSVGGAVLVVVDYNQGWFTKSLATNVSFLAGLVPILVCINVLAGLIAAYFLIRDFMDDRNPHPENVGELTRRNVITMGCLLLVGILTVGLQEVVDSRRGQLRQSSVSAIPISSTGNIATQTGTRPTGSNLNTPTGEMVPNVQPSTENLPYFMTRILLASDLDGKSAQELDVMRNEIYARHGRKFLNPKLQAYFSAQSWYTPVYEPASFPPSLLTPVQVKNVNLLSSREKQLQ